LGGHFIPPYYLVRWRQLDFLFILPNVKTTAFDCATLHFALPLPLLHYRRPAGTAVYWFSPFSATATRFSRALPLCSMRAGLIVSPRRLQVRTRSRDCVTSELTRRFHRAAARAARLPTSRTAARAATTRSTLAYALPLSSAARSHAHAHANASPDVTLGASSRVLPLAFWHRFKLRPRCVACLTICSISRDTLSCSTPNGSGVIGFLADLPSRWHPTTPCDTKPSTRADATACIYHALYGRNQRTYDHCRPT